MNVLITAVLLLPLVPALAQPVAQPAAPLATQAQSEIVVQGRRTQPSKWREAETAHVIVLSNGDERELTRTAHDLERLYFLLSGLLGRGDKTDDTVRLRVTLIGDAAEFEMMKLRNTRWQQGPYPTPFHHERYYDPREDGSVLATTRIDQSVTIDRSITQAQARELLLEPSSGQSGPGAGTTGSFAGSSGTTLGTSGASFGGSALTGLSSRSDPLFGGDAGSFPLPASYMLYAGFAQHFLLTNFPAAYPRWYLDGFGELFGTMSTRGDNKIEYGSVPIGTSATLEHYGDFPLSSVFDESYLAPRKGRVGWTPMHAWMLTHFLFFSDTRRPQLRRYLLAYANGATSAQAASAFGDLGELAKELRHYYRAKKPFDRITYPAGLADTPTVRRLSEGEAAFVKGRLELGSRIEPPPAPTPDMDPKTAARAAEAQTKALAERDRWLDRLRRDAARYDKDLGAQLLLAEAECRLGHTAPCAAAADHALALAPTDSSALAWKGTAMTQAAVAGSADDRARALKAARVVIAQANRQDNDAVPPLLAYYRNYAAAGAEVPPIAVDALTKVVMRVPNAPVPRVALGRELVRNGAVIDARRTLRPVANGGFDTPERATAKAMLVKIGEE